MRNAALWITPWADRDRYVVLDTAALTEAEWRAVVRYDRDPMPADTVLVLVHPDRHRRIVDSITHTWAPSDPVRLAWQADPNGRGVAITIINEQCSRDPELRRRLRW